MSAGRGHAGLSAGRNSSGLQQQVPTTQAALTSVMLCMRTCIGSLYSPHAGNHTHIHLCCPGRWVQGECRNIGEFDAPEVGPMLQAAVRALRERPVLFKYCAEEVATARHNALFQRFITALTRGGPGGMPRPIEIHAHDPKRYVNDMLAWVHQALAGEHEFVVALFGGDKAAGGALSGGGEQSGAAGRGPGSRTIAEEVSDDSDDAMSSAALLDRIFESICRPLRVRIEQVGDATAAQCFTVLLFHFLYSLTPYGSLHSTL